MEGYYVVVDGNNAWIEDETGKEYEDVGRELRVETDGSIIMIGPFTELATE